MRIIIQAAAADRDIGDEVRRAIEVLRIALILVSGGGTVERDGTAYGVILLSSSNDAALALEVLTTAGIVASMD